MKKWTVGEALLLCAAVLAAVCAILLPPSLSRLADHRLMEAEYAVQAETLDVSLVYQMSTAQRLALLARAGEEDLLVFNGGPPAQDELSADQAVALCQEELDRLYELGVLPGRFSLSNSDGSFRYTMLCDRDDRQRSISLWVLSTSKDSGYDFGYACTLVMDAQTGLIYSLQLVLDGIPEFSLEDAARSWGTYLELGAPAIQDKYEFASSEGITDAVNCVVGQGFQSLSAAYGTDEGTITCSFKVEQNPDPKLPTISVTISPVPPPSEQ